ncbi:Oidioi.mRNA.OKI2018_I69.XSR.g16181.t1.cds [Oikopleura dioica]|uniref:Oidioi.mRNA.OKI2018_I69.XSR.g16181.t1.cds n=1 Tax=Oikopleura dioica TaxID=34765 RepID=A0ABN7SJA9_OIKDI|nr:Oidioi.mRNA.OKI2018_I69.XSR.g16181.t1.cds [Oikopleura dioica]
MQIINFLFLLGSFLQRSNACRVLCGGIIGRKRRETQVEEEEKVRTEGKVKETFWGCAPWWAQISLCLKVYYRGFKKEVSESQFYRVASRTCDEFCIASIDSEKCADCWSSIAKNSFQLYDIYCNWSMKEEQCPGARNTTQYSFFEYKETIERCIQTYVPAHVDATEPEIASSKPVSIKDRKIRKKCEFKKSDIDIVWDESFPSQKFPQVSSIPHMNRRQISEIVTDFKHKSGSIARNSETMQNDAVRPQKGLLYVDSQAIDLYEQLIGNDWKESHDHLFGSRRQERRRRQISKQDSPNLQLGLHFPCMIKNLSLVSYPNDVTSGAQNLARMAYGSATVDGLNNKFFVSIPKPEPIEEAVGMLFDAANSGLERQRFLEEQSYQALEFEIDYGEGCFFDATRIKARMEPVVRTSCTDDQLNETICSEFEVCVTKKRVSTRNKEEFIIRSKCLTREKSQCPEAMGSWSLESPSGAAFCCCKGQRCNRENCTL